MCAFLFPNMREYRVSGESCAIGVGSLFGAADRSAPIGALVTVGRVPTLASNYGQQVVEGSVSLRRKAQASSACSVMPLAGVVSVDIIITIVSGDRTRIRGAESIPFIRGLGPCRSATHDKDARVALGCHFGSTLRRDSRPTLC